jgi:predicted nucleic acid-binding protein
VADELVLDTNAFNERGFVHFLKGHAGRKILPSVAAAEYYYHLRNNRGWSLERFLALLRETDVVVEPLDRGRALAAVEAADRAFTTRRADALIAAHALAPGKLLVTRNPADYPQVPRKTTPAALMSHG